MESTLKRSFGIIGQNKYRKLNSITQLF